MDFNDIFILECYANPEDKEFFDLFVIPSLKDFNLSARHQALKKGEYLVEDPSDSSKLILSVKGKHTLDQLKELSLMSFKAILIDFSETVKNEDEMFEEWWKTYPTSPSWTSDDGNTTFSASRTLKNLRKPEAKKRYLKLLNQGLKHEELLGALKYEIQLIKLDSIKKNENKMIYFKGMESYLNTERYLLYIDEYRKDPSFVQNNQKVKSKKANVTDI